MNYAHKRLVDIDYHEAPLRCDPLSDQALLMLLTLLRDCSPRTCQDARFAVKQDSRRNQPLFTPLTRKLFVARSLERPEEPLGAALVVRPFMSRIATLSLFAVHENYRRQGIGQSLLNFAEEQSALRGAFVMFLDSVPRAVPFYEDQGYLTLQASRDFRRPMQKSI